MLTTTYQPSTLSLLIHEVRIPVTGIFGMIQFLRQSQLTEQQIEYLAIIELSAMRLLSLESKLKCMLQE